MSFDHSRQFIGASECASIIGLDDYRTKIAVWDRLVNGTVSESGPLAKRGNAIEPGLIIFYRNETGRTVQAPVKTRLHPKHSFIGATPDGIDGEEVVECKAPSPRMLWLWADEDVPARYVVQTTIQCDVFGSPRAQMVVDLGDRVEFRTVEHDPELAGEVTDQVAKFYRDHVVTKKAPEPDGSSSYSDWLDRRFPGVKRDMREATPDEVRLAMELEHARKQADYAKEEAERLRQELEVRIGDAKGITGPFGSIVWSDTKGRESLDAKALKAAHPDIAKQFIKQGAGFRTFRCTFKGAA